MHLDLDKQPEWFVYAADVGWDRRPHFQGADDCGIDRKFDGRGFVAEEAVRLQQKREGQLRALFLGDSSTFGACRTTAETFVGVANRLVPQALSMNLGVNGYTSYQGYKALLKYGEFIDPDIIFISFNFNDRRFVLQPEQADGDAAFQQLYSSSLVRDPTEASPAAPRMISDMFTAEVRLDKVRPRVDPKEYRENLTKMAQWAKRHGSAVVFILLGDNPDQTSTLREGARHLSEKNYAAAIKSLTEAKDDSDHVWFSALARLYLSEAYRKTGRHDEAEQVLSMKDALAGLTGGYPIVLDSDYHRIMRVVADEHGSLLVDAASELNKDTSVYWDFCHFDGRGHAAVGRLVAGVIETARKRGRNSDSALCRCFRCADGAIRLAPIAPYTLPCKRGARP